MAQHGCFRTTRRARSELDLRGRVRIDFRQFRRDFGRTNVLEPVFEPHCLAETWRLWEDFAYECFHVRATEVADIEDRGRVRSVEHMSEFSAAQCRVRSYENKSGERGTVLQYDPFGYVRRPNCDV